MTAEQLANALDGRRSGRGWTCRCPAHEDRSPSLSLREGDGGRILVHCFSGCSQSDVIAAIRARGLWPETPRSEWTPRERHEWGQQQWRARQDAKAARWWAISEAALLEQVLEGLAWCDPSRVHYTRLLAVIRTGGAGVLGEYRQCRQSEPEVTAAMVRAGRDAERRWQTATARFLMTEVQTNAA